MQRSPAALDDGASGRCWRSLHHPVRPEATPGRIRSTFVAMIFCISVGAEERLAHWRPLGSLHAVCTGLWKALARENSFVLMLVNFQPSSLRAPHMPSLCFIVGQQACTNTPKLRGRSCGRSHSIPSCVPGVFPRPFPHTARKRRRLCTGAHGGRDWAWCESAFFESTLAHAHSTRRPVPSPLWAQTNKIWSILQYIPPPAVKKISA